MANRSRSRSRERPGPSRLRRGDASPDSRCGRTFNKVHPRADRLREDREYRSDSSRAHFSSLRDDRQRRVDEFVDRRPDVRRPGGEDAGRREQRHGMSSANSRGRPSDSRADSRERADWRPEDPRRDQQGRHRVREAPKDKRPPLLSGRGEIMQGLRPPASNNHGAGGRPSAVQIQLNKRIVGARNFEDVLAIVEAEHGEFNALNVATACSRLAKAPRTSANRTSIDIAVPFSGP